MLLGVLLAVVLSVIFVKIISNVAEKKVLELVNNELAPNSFLEYDDLSLSVFPIRITIKDARLVHYQPWEEQSHRKPADAIRRLEFSGAELRDIKLIKLIRGKSRDIGSVTVHDLALDLRFNSFNTDAGAEGAADLIPVSISDIRLVNSSIGLYRGRAADRAEWQADALDIHIENFKTGEQKADLHSYFENVLIKADKITHYTQNGFYEILSDEILIDSRNRIFSIEAFHVNPLKTPVEIAASQGHQSDVFYIESGPIQLKEPDIERWLQHDDIIAEALTLQDFAMTVRRDKGFPDNQRHERPLPHAALANLPFIVQVDTVRVTNGDISYSEEFFEEGRKGVVSFNEINLEILALQNQHADQIIAVTASTKFMGTGELDIEFEFYPDPNGLHTVSVSLGEMDLTQAAEPLEGLAFVKVNSGNLTSIDLVFTASDNSSYGNFLMVYDDLEIRILNKESLEQGTKTKVLSFIANTLAIRTNNRGDNPKAVTLGYEREKDRSMFNYWWRTIQGGLLDTAKR